MRDTIDSKLKLAETIIDKKTDADISHLIQNLAAESTYDNGKYIKAYIYTCIFWPFGGIYYFVKYMFIEENTMPALICLAISLVFLLLFWLLTPVLFPAGIFNFVQPGI